MTGRPLGQVFLASPRVAARIVAALGAEPGENCVEIGPGKGALTALLHATGARLTLVEIDPTLAALLAQRYPQATVICGDATDKDVIRKALGNGALVVGNLPYNAAGPILGALLANRALVKRMVLMFQREVAQRIAASIGDREYGGLSLMVQCRARVEYLFEVSPQSFRPVPRVWSAVLRLTPQDLPHPCAAVADEKAFLDLALAVHTCPRKTVANSLARGLGISRLEAEGLLRQAQIEPGVRPASVGPVDLLNLYMAIRGSALR